MFYKPVEMLQKLSLLIPCDSTGVFLARIFHIYQHSVGTVGCFVKASIRVTKPRCRIKKKKKIKNFIIRTRGPLNLADTTNYVTITNASVLLKKRLSMRGKVVFGPTSYTIKRKKFLKSFARIL